MDYISQISVSRISVCILFTIYFFFCIFFLNNKGKTLNKGQKRTPIALISDLAYCSKSKVIK